MCCTIRTLPSVLILFHRSNALKRLMDRLCRLWPWLRCQPGIHLSQVFREHQTHRCGINLRRNICVSCSRHRVVFDVIRDKGGKPGHRILCDTSCADTGSEDHHRRLADLNAGDLRVRLGSEDTILQVWAIVPLHNSPGTLLDYHYLEIHQQSLQLNKRENLLCGFAFYSILYVSVAQSFT